MTCWQGFMYMYNTLNIVINPGTLQLELQYLPIFKTGNIKKLYADHLATPQNKMMHIAP